MDQGTLQGIGTILVMLAFFGICWWAFSKHKKKDFEEASQLPFADDDNNRQTKDPSQDDDSSRKN